MPEYQSAKTLSVYLSMPTGEISTARIVRRALQDGKNVFVPYLYKSLKTGKPKAVMDMVALHGEADYDALQPDKWGIPSVSPTTVLERRRCLGDENELGSEGQLQVQNALDLIIVPGVAFDKNLQRLGHGKGFYDSFFSNYFSSHIGGGKHDRAVTPHLGITP